MGYIFSPIAKTNWMREKNATIINIKKGSKLIIQIYEPKLLTLWPKHENESSCKWIFHREYFPWNNSIHRSNVWINCRMHDDECISIWIIVKVSRYSQMYTFRLRYKWSKFRLNNPKESIDPKARSFQRLDTVELHQNFHSLAIKSR